MPLSNKMFYFSESTRYEHHLLLLLIHKLPLWWSFSTFVWFSRFLKEMYGDLPDLLTQSLAAICETY